VTPPIGTQPRPPAAPPPPPPPAPPPPAAAPAKPAAPAKADTYSSAPLPYGPRYEDAKAGKSVLRPDTQGPAVEKLQHNLKMAGYDVPTDGKYDAKTKKAVTDFQASHGIKAGPQAPTGWADQHTLGAVEKDLDTRRAAVSQFPAGSDDRATMKSLVQNPGFNGLNNDERDRMLRSMSGNDKGAQYGRETMKASLLDNEGFKGLPPAAQTKLLRDFTKSNLQSPPNVSEKPGHFDGKGVPCPMDPTKEIGAYKVDSTEIDGRKIPIQSPKTAGSDGVPSAEDAAKAIAMLPPADRARVKNVVITDQPQTNKDKTAAFDPETGTVGIFKHPDNSDNQKLAGTLTHEVGHGLGHDKLGADGSNGWKKWEKAIASDGVPPSQYGTKNADEDFAESYRLYQSVKGTPEEAAVRARHPARFKMIDEMS